MAGAPWEATARKRLDHVQRLRVQLGQYTYTEGSVNNHGVRRNGAQISNHIEPSVGTEENHREEIKDGADNIYSMASKPNQLESLEARNILAVLGQPKVVILLQVLTLSTAGEGSSSTVWVGGELCSGGGVTFFSAAAAMMWIRKQKGGGVSV